MSFFQAIRSINVAFGLIALALSSATAATTNLSAWVYPGAGGHLIAQPDMLGNRISDFSGIGYRSGAVPLPSTNVVPVKIVVTPVAGDNVSNIQAAINYVSGLSIDANGFRGAVYLSNGVYNVGSQIKISKSGVVLRGAGSNTNGSGTLLYATATNLQSVLIEVTGSGSASTISGTTHTITNGYLPAGARSFYVDSASGLSVGQTIYVERFATSNWIHDLGMDLLGPPPDVPWTPSGYNINMERTITRIEGNHIFIDAPITCAIDTLRYSSGSIRAFTWSSRITNCAVEHIFAQSWYGGNVTNENHQQSFIQFDSVVNGWVRDVACQYFVVYCVSFNDNNKWCTCQDSTSLDPISIITGGRRYAFNINGSQDCLFKNCYTRQDRHQFVTESVTIGPNAFVDGVSDSAHAEAGPHQRWATDILWDNIVVHGGNNDIQNAGNFGTGHGWEGANSLIWNNNANGFIVQNPPGARNWLIGSIGPIQTGTAWNIGYTNMPHDAGTYESSGSSAQHVYPNSLYFAQVQDHLAVPGTQAREYWLGIIDGFTNTIARDPVALDTTWSNTVKSAASGQLLDAFNVVTNNHWIPFTFNFNVSSNEHVVAATLSVAMRAVSSAASDVLYLGSLTNSFTFSGLGWSVGTGTNTTVRVLDLANQLGSVTNGQLNIAVQGDAGIDWTMLEVSTAPNAATFSTILTPAADATVRGGASAGSNFGTATTLTVRQDSSANNIQNAYLRWDLNSLTGSVYQARIVLTPTSVPANNIEQGVAVTIWNNWTEAGVTWNSQPGGVERFATWIAPTNGTVSFDVTPQVLDALQSDKQLSVKLFSVTTNTVDYASRDSVDSSTWPRLVISQLGSAPTISDITDHTIAPNTSTGPIAFTIGGGSVNSLTLSGNSSNDSLVPDGNIVFGGSGTNRTVTITPLTNQSGLAVITVTVSDPGGLSASDVFTLTVASHAASTLVWNGPGAGANTWSATNDWLPALAPEFQDTVKFFDAGNVGTVSNINNYVSSDATIAGMQVGNINGNHTTLIGAGNTLNITGTGGLVVGTETDNGNAQLVSAAITGIGGTLDLNNGGANLIVRQGSSLSGSQRAMLDMSGLGEFDAAINQISVGIAGVNRPAGTLYLARTNNITLAASPGIFAADSGSNGGAQSFIYLGISNQVYADAITIGSQKSSASLAFAPYFTNQNPTLYLRSQTGDRVSLWLIGDNSKQSVSGSGCSGTVDFSGGAVDVMVDTVYVGKGQTSSGLGTATGSLSLKNGAFDVNTLEAGYENSTTAGAVVSGTVNVNGTATLQVNTTLRLARLVNNNSNFPVGVLNLTGGTVTGAGNITAGGGTSTVNVNGGTLAVATIGAPAAPVGKIALTNSTLQFAVAAGTTNLVASALVTGGSSNAVVIGSLPSIGSFPAQFPLIVYSNTIGGAGYNFVLGTIPNGAFAYLSNNVANSSVDLVVTSFSIPDSFLTWNGSASGDWDTESGNWKNNIAPNLQYNDGSDVVFNDLASGTTTVNLTDTFLPNSVTVSNNAKLYVFDGDGNLSGAMTLAKQGAGTLVIANTATNDFTGSITIGGGTLTVGDGTANGNLPAGDSIANAGVLAFNRPDNVVVPNSISGSGLVMQAGAGLLQLSATNTITGNVMVTNGTLRPSNLSAFGAVGNITVITNAGTLDVNGLALTNRPVTVSGGGANTNGAIINTGPSQTSALRNVTLAGDIIIGGNTRWDIRNTAGSASLNTLPAGSSYKITKVGTNQVSLVGVSTIDSALGDVDIQQGTFAVQTSTTRLGNSAANVIIHSNATLNFFTLSTPFNKNIVVQDGGVVFNEKGPSYISGGSTITLLGNAIFDVTNSGAPPTLNCSNVLTGAGNLIVTGGGTLVLNGTNTYTGNTLVTTGSLAIAANGSISNTANITLTAPGTLDLSSHNGFSFVLNSGQTLTGNGTINGGLTVNSNATFAPGGASPGAFTVGGISGVVVLKGNISMRLNKTAHTNDVLVSGLLTYSGGTLFVTNLSGTLAATDSFKLFAATGYGVSGQLLNVVPLTPGPGLLWNTNTLLFDGVLRVTNAPAAAPRFGALMVSGNNIILSGTNGAAGNPYKIFTSTNIALPLGVWTPIWTNNFDNNGNFSFTNPISTSAPQVFYLLQY